ncbi:MULTISPECIES: peroxiredoxin [Actinokineospora]|uniref:Alkyl hydroperoxide reductase E n=2 Tax=Actinokineospora TaxID=39845 RepID=A0A1H0JT32_9PSEU|nr:MULTISPECIES: peroxiredoxin [Actinokineospora]MBC6451637.1 peroxiredoxin [Actinokineospora xionganensis]TDP68172.1 peroxiredoxin [Actinokineospora alba]SDH93598.1 Peroxiredoxin [Actinokineospora alba]SDO46955.1 Peroxiredoxin [Actinokineospora alba]
MAVAVGSKAPDFTLNDYNKQPVKLSDFQGSKNVLLVFYPFAFSGICTGELCQVRDELSTYTDSDVQVIGVSVDTPFSLKAWAEQEGYTFPLLSDFWPHGAVATEYGVFNEAAGLANRGTFLIDTEGVVQFAEINAPGEARDQDAWKKAVSSLKG